MQRHWPAVAINQEPLNQNEDNDRPFECKDMALPPVANDLTSAAIDKILPECLVDSPVVQSGKANASKISGTILGTIGGATAGGTILGGVAAAAGIAASGPVGWVIGLSVLGGAVGLGIIGFGAGLIAGSASDDKYRELSDEIEREGFERINNVAIPALLNQHREFNFEQAELERQLLELRVEFAAVQERNRNRIAEFQERLREGDLATLRQRNKRRRLRDLNLELERLIVPLSNQLRAIERQRNRLQERIEGLEMHLNLAENIIQKLANHEPLNQVEEDYRAQLLAQYLRRNQHEPR